MPTLIHTLPPRLVLYYGWCLKCVFTEERVVGRRSGDRYFRLVLCVCVLKAPGGPCQLCCCPFWPHQVWDASGAKSPGSPSIAPALIKRGYDVVLSNSDFTYLDCGGSGWVAPGGYWCKPYLEWYTLYDYVPAVRDLWGLSRADMAHVKGAEVLIWGETADASNLMQKVWPRAAALAERLWTHPAGVSSEKHVDGRMQMHRHRLVDRGIAAEALQPLWCEQHGMACSLKGWKRQGVPQRPKRPRNMKKIAITD